MSSAAPTLLVGGQAYGGWTALRVRTSIEHCAGAADLEVTERWPGGDLPPLRPGLGAVLQLGSETVITGWIDGVSRDLGPTNRTVQLAVRDATGDLVDCAALVRQYTGQGLLAIAQDQLAPFVGADGAAMPVTANVDLGGPFKREAVEPGQTVWEFLEHLARQRGALLMADGRGGLLIGQPGGEAAPAPLVLGQNLLGVRAVADWRDRFSDYVVYGQSAGDDEWHGAQAAQIRATAQDAEVAGSRHRLYVTTAEDGETDLAARAQWEQRVRYGRALQVQAQVQGWTAGGALWRAGQLAQVEAPGLGIAEPLLIVGCAYTLDQRGTTTDLQLTRPAAFAPGAPLMARAGAPPAHGAGWWM